MNIGIPRERRPDENRVGLTPWRVEALAAAGHRCYVEQGAGVGAGFSDESYTRAGGQIVYSGEEVYGRADLVVKVGRPTNEEMNWLRTGQAVMAFWHLAAAHPAKLDLLLRRHITSIAYEMIQNDDGSLPVLRSMSQIAGRMSAHIAAGLLQNDRGGKGVLLGGLPGVAPAEVVVLGAGVVGTNAARAFAGLGATVYVLDRDVNRLERLTEQGNRFITLFSHPHNIEKVVHFADVVIGAVLVPGSRAPVLVTRDMVRKMRRRSVIVDIAIDQGGCIETSRPTTHQSPTFLVDDVIHYCVPNMAGVLGRTATHALTNATARYISYMVEHGIEAAIDGTALGRGVVTHNGQITATALSRGEL